MRSEGTELTTGQAPGRAAEGSAERMLSGDEAGSAAEPATLDDLVGIVAVQVRAQASRIQELELALADAEARILSQARLICGATAAANSDLFNRRPVRAIIEEVLGAYPGISFEDIIGVGRERRLVEPRHRCMTAVYDERPDLSLPALGRIFRRDHTSVLHAVNKREPGNARRRGRTQQPGRLPANAGADGIGAPAF
ncbi:helix-turn-helix domain-containing protein [Ensifer sp. SL37]|uniref:helix-turn-helix domain-containing protein n=1 Tax=Ensifer sp. SL37 TaxID=2995137 RepID=UPI002274DAD0|nr:helix-turn-helix domain-containing protein [Ensifer sp. SL37]MCY1744083.1 chromosomal replication initiator DnaA [Ensifer sp. SL37]